MPIDPAEFERLRQLADGELFREEECTPILDWATDILLPQTPVASVSLTREQRNPYGRSDYIVAADLKSELGNVERFVYFWELKAPQCFLLEIDDAHGRYRPTKELIKAETQLLHYVHQAVNDNDFKARMNIVHPQNVRMGGIIIGTDQRTVKPGERSVKDDAAHSFRIRNDRIYERAQLKVMTWDRIFDFVRPR